MGRPIKTWYPIDDLDDRLVSNPNAHRHMWFRLKLLRKAKEERGEFNRKRALAILAFWFRIGRHPYARRTRAEVNRGCR